MDSLKLFNLSFGDQTFFSLLTQSHWAAIVTPTNDDRSAFCRNKSSLIMHSVDSQVETIGNITVIWEKQLALVTGAFVIRRPNTFDQFW